MGTLIELKVASGCKLPLMQEQLRIDGHSMEARIYAENPLNNFMPDLGELKYLRQPFEEFDSNREPTVRVETGIREKDQVSVFYDPMIAKLVVKGETREKAIKLLRRKLDEYRIVGVKNNVDFVKKILENQA